MRKIFVPFIVLFLSLSACGDAYEDEIEPVQNNLPLEQEVEAEGTGEAETGKDIDHLRLITYARVIEEKLTENVPEELYGGTYYDRMGNIVIQLCEDTEENEAAVKDLLVGEVEEEYLEYIRFAECQYSYSFLEEIQQTILEEYEEEIIQVYAVPEDENCRVIINKHDKKLETEILAYVETKIPSVSEEEGIIVFLTNDEITDK